MLALLCARKTGERGRRERSELAARDIIAATSMEARPLRPFGVNDCGVGNLAPTARFVVRKWPVIAPRALMRGPRTIPRDRGAVEVGFIWSFASYIMNRDVAARHRRMVGFGADPFDSCWCKDMSFMHKARQPQKNVHTPAVATSGCNYGSGKIQQAGVLCCASARELDSSTGNFSTGPVRSL